MKKEWVKPEIKFITDPDIILGCLYEVLSWDVSMRCMDRKRSLYWLERISGIR